MRVFKLTRLFYHHIGATQTIQDGIVRLLRNNIRPSTRSIYGTPWVWGSVGARNNGDWALDIKIVLPGLRH